MSNRLRAGKDLDRSRSNHLRVIRTANPIIELKTCSRQIYNGIGEGCMSTGIFMGPDNEMYEVTVAHPFQNVGDKVYIEPNDQEGNVYAECKMLQPGFVSGLADKYTADVAILHIRHYVEVTESKVELIYRSEGSKDIRRHVQPKLFRGEIRENLEICILNRYGVVVEGLIRKLIPLEVFNIKGKSESMYNIIAISDKNGRAITEQGDSGSICFLKPSLNSSEILVFGMAVSRDVDTAAMKTRTYAVRIPAVLDAIMPSLFTAYQGFKVEFCSGKQSDAETVADSGVGADATGGV